jgi:hypothetical protein
MNVQRKEGEKRKIGTLVGNGRELYSEVAMTREQAKHVASSVRSELGMCSDRAEKSHGPRETRRLEVRSDSTAKVVCSAGRGGGGQVWGFLKL